MARNAQKDSSLLLLRALRAVAVKFFPVCSRSPPSASFGRLFALRPRAGPAGAASQQLSLSNRFVPLGSVFRSFKDSIPPPASGSSPRPRLATLRIPPASVPSSLLAKPTCYLKRPDHSRRRSTEARRDGGTARSQILIGSGSIAIATCSSAQRFSAASRICRFARNRAFAFG